MEDNLCQLRLFILGQGNLLSKQVAHRTTHRFSHVSNVVVPASLSRELYTLFEKKHNFFKLHFFFRRVYASESGDIHHFINQNIKTLGQDQWPRGNWENGQKKGVGIEHQTPSPLSLPCKFEKKLGTWDSWESRENKNVLYSPWRIEGINGY